MNGAQRASGRVRSPGREQRPQARAVDDRDDADQHQAADTLFFVCGLARRNQRWVDGTRILSPRLITDMLRWSGEQLDAHLGPVDLAGSSSVYWAGEVPLWFDLAREFTERWVHYRQIQEAARPAGHDHPADEYLPLVLRTFIWGFPHQYRAPAPSGTAIVLQISGTGAWTLTKTATGWSLDEGQATAPAASLRISGEAAWRMLTGARYDPRQVQLSGDPRWPSPSCGSAASSFSPEAGTVPPGPTPTHRPAQPPRGRSRVRPVRGP